MKVARDGGGIYTLGQQPNSVIAGNYIKTAHRDPGGIYNDEGTAYYSVRNNVLDSVEQWFYIWTSSIHDITFSNNYTTTSNSINNGTNIIITNTTVVSDANWPQAARDIINNAGLEAAYRDLLALIPAPSTNAAPIVEAGNSRALSLIETITLNGLVSDDNLPYGVIKSRWVKDSGPGTVTFSDSSLTRTKASFSKAGTYVLRLTADDGELTGSDTVTYTVSDVALGLNIALNKPRKSSSDLNFNVDATKANDGNEGSIWHSNFGDKDSWWQVDLGAEYPLLRIEFVARQEAQYDYNFTRNNFEVRASNNSDFSTYTVLGGRGADPFPHQGTWTLNVIDSGKYRYLRVARTVQEVSTIAEFRVFSLMSGHIS